MGSHIPATLFPTVGINRPGTDQWPVLMHELDEIARWVRTRAVPRLVTGMEPPEPALPTRYEIAVGHDNERRALSAGSTTTALERHQQRLDAAMVRSELADTISRMDGSPSARQITTWLAQLTDEEVLDRMSRLKPSTHDADVMLRNFEVMKGMRDEALEFAGDGGSTPSGAG
jgi:hypothetical protein